MVNSECAIEMQAHHTEKKSGRVQGTPFSLGTVSGCALWLDPAVSLGFGVIERPPGLALPVWGWILLRHLSWAGSYNLFC